MKLTSNSPNSLYSEEDLANLNSFYFLVWISTLVLDSQISEMGRFPCFPWTLFLLKLSFFFNFLSSLFRSFCLSNRNTGTWEFLFWVRDSSAAAAPATKVELEACGQDARPGDPRPLHRRRRCDPVCLGLRPPPSSLASPSSSPSTSTSASSSSSSTNSSPSSSEHQPPARPQERAAPQSDARIRSGQQRERRPALAHQSDAETARPTVRPARRLLRPTAARRRPAAPPPARRRGGAAAAAAAAAASAQGSLDERRRRRCANGGAHVAQLVVLDGHGPHHVGLHFGRLLRRLATAPQIQTGNANRKQPREQTLVGFPVGDSFSGVLPSFVVVVDGHIHLGPHFADSNFGSHFMEFFYRVVSYRTRN